MVRVYLYCVAQDVGVCGSDDVEISADLKIFRRENLINVPNFSTFKA